MKDSRLLQKLFFLLFAGCFLCTLQACGGDDEAIDEETIADPTNDYGKITNNSLVATGGYRDVKPLRATILSSINTIYQGAYSSLGVEFTPHQPDFNSSETRSVNSNSGVTNGHFETVLSSGGEGLLEPGTTYYYRSYAYMGGSRYNGEVRSFVTPDIQLSEEKLVDLGLSVKWASCNMGANAPETIGTLVKQHYAYNNFNGYSDYLPNNVNDYNWLGNSNYDVATRTLGSGYRIPTEQEWQELEEKCNWKSGVLNGVKGFYIYDRIDGTGVIFLPYVKKSSKHDITVYLSATDDMIRNIREVMELVEQYHNSLSDTSHFLSVAQQSYRSATYLFNRLLIERELGVGEILTESTHIYCNEGLILRVFDDTNPWGEEELVDGWLRSGALLDYEPSPGIDYYQHLIWTHPETGKQYNFHEENNGNGGGVLYLRPVSNR